MTPRRIQMTRHKPWRAENPTAVICDRRTPWGNPFTVGRTTPTTWSLHGGIYVRDAAHAVELYRDLIAASARFQADIRNDLRGRDLASWCEIGAPCHADVLLEIANTPAPSDGRTDQ